MLSPYNLTFLENSTYEFRTVHDVVYSVYFIDGSSYFTDYPDFAADVLTFGFDLKYSSHFKIPADDRVRITISKIIISFFDANPDKILFFVCDTKDRKQLSRINTFERWHRYANHYSLEKYNEFIQAEDISVYCSVILHKENLLKNRIR